VRLLFRLPVIGYEEPTLRDKVGAECGRYLRALPRWLPSTAVGHSTRNGANYL